MTKTKYWLSLLAISVVLVAGSLAVSPIANADDDDDDDGDDDGDDNERVSVTTTLGQIPAGGVLVLLDTTGSGTLTNVHVAANLPCADSESAPSNGIAVVAGVAGPGFPGNGIPLISIADDNTGFPGPAGTCIFHGTTTGQEPGTITDVVLVAFGGISSQTTITITGTYN